MRNDSYFPLGEATGLSNDKIVVKDMNINVLLNSTLKLEFRKS